MKKSVFILDDERSICESLRFALQRDYAVDTCTDAEQGMVELRRKKYDVLLLDVRLGLFSGMDVLTAIKTADVETEVILMTAYGNEKASAEAMKQGAFSYLMKPLDLDALRLVIKKAIEHQRIKEDLDAVTSQLENQTKYQRLVGDSPAMRRVFKIIDMLKDVDSNVLITGESGTGKELAARAIHDFGSRQHGRFVAVNCAAIPDGLLESTFFGHKKGAFTGAVADQKGKFQQADNGTIFLDEIGDMPLSIQAKILRVLQTKEVIPVGGIEPIKVNVRVISATNRDLREMVADGRFREDLFYRLNVANIHLPPLRDRKEDILLLCDHFIQQFNAELKKHITGISDSAKQKLLQYDYPGNIRQLSNIVEYAMIFTSGENISSFALPDELTADKSMEGTGQSTGLDLGSMTLKELEKLAIEATLNKTGGKKAEAARSLGISERSLWYKVKEYNII